MYTLKCGDGVTGCGATSEVEILGVDAEGFIFVLTPDGSRYLCPNGCQISEVFVYEEDANEVDESEYSEDAGVIHGI
jgi:hypothetical protein